MAIYFKGTLKNNIILGNKTNVRECLKIILRNKMYPFLPTYIPPTQHILWHFLEIIIHFCPIVIKNITVFLFTQQRQKMHAKIFSSLPTHPKIQGRGISNT